MSPQSFLLGAVLVAMTSLGIAVAVYRVTGHDSRRTVADALALGIGAAPFVLGLAVIFAIAALGESSDITYVGLLFGMTGVPLLLSAKAIRTMAVGIAKSACSVFRTTPSIWRLVLRVETALAAVLLLQLAWLVYVVIAVPLVANDPLEYAEVAKVLYQRRELRAYPLIEPDPATGMYAPWTHPPMYVALIFLAYTLQESSAYAGLVRLIPLWCLLATLLVLSRVVLSTLPGSLGRRTALTSAIVLLSTPFLRQMVGESSIDALPILGLTVAFASTCLFSDAPLRTRSTLGGVALGLSLWAHSAAILFPILVLFGVAIMRRSLRRPFAAECAWILLVACAIGILPYVRNQLIFGSPISDTPAVVTLRQLDWESYFTTGRGMSTAYEMIVIGVFRGWIANLDFGLTFWLMSLGIVLLAYRIIRRDVNFPGHYMLMAALAIVVTFHVGMMVSVLLGTTLFVKNPRYLLPIVPFAALIGGFALSEVAVFHRIGSIKAWHNRNRVAIEFQWRRNWIGPAAGLMLLIAVLHVCIDQVSIAANYWRTILVSLRRSFWAPQSEVLTNFQFYRVQQYIRNNLPAESLILSLRPADMYYAHHRMQSYLDPRMIPAYEASDTTKLSELLRRLGVTHVYKPNYSMPVIYNSALMQLLADQRLSRLVHSDHNYAVYALLREPAGENSHGRTWDLTPARHRWSGTSGADFSTVFRTLCGAVNFHLDSALPQPTGRRCHWAPLHRAIYVSGVGSPYDINDANSVAVAPEYTYRYLLDVEGSGTLRMVIYSKRDKTIIEEQIDDAVLARHRRTFTGLFRVPAGVTRIRFSLWMEGNGELSIHDVRLEELGVSASVGLSSSESPSPSSARPAQ